MQSEKNSNVKSVVQVSSQKDTSGGVQIASRMHGEYTIFYLSSCMNVLWTENNQYYPGTDMHTNVICYVIIWTIE